VAQLRQHEAELEALQTRVVVVSFGSTAGAQAWLLETGAPFMFLLDPDRAAYRAYGLEHSFARAWGLNAWRRYAQLLLAGRKWRGIQGDSGQLGGDFIVDAAGIIRLAYPSHDPADRPLLSRLITVLSNCSAANRKAESER
jgi:alkyl hydroperoxide reductase subunit AhpC